MRYSCVTVYKNKGSFWERYVYDKSYVRRIHLIKEKRAERYDSSSLTVRIFSEKAREIEPGDRIIEGMGPKNPPENALTVFETRDNFILTNGHIRITAS